MMNRILDRPGSNRRRPREIRSKSAAPPSKVLDLLDFISKQPDGACDLQRARRFRGRSTFDHCRKHHLIITAPCQGRARVMCNICSSNKRSLAEACAKAS